MKKTFLIIGSDGTTGGSHLPWSADNIRYKIGQLYPQANAKIYSPYESPPDEDDFDRIVQVLVENVATKCRC